MHCTDDTDNLTAGCAVAPAATVAAAEAAAAVAAAAAAGGGLNYPASAVPGVVAGGAGENISGGNIVDTARRWLTNNTMIGTSGVGGRRAVASQGAPEGGNEEDSEEDDEEAEGQREIEEGETWWAGEEFEGDWACLFEAYLPEGGIRRMPCLVAREVGPTGVA